MDVIMTLYVQMTKPNNGYACDKEAAKLLDPLQYYEVSDVDMGSSSTTIYLESNRFGYNSVNFTFYKLIDGKLEEYDIFSDPEYNPYL